MKIARMTKGTWGLNTAFFDVEIVEGVTIKGFRLIKKDEGTPNEKTFVGVPSKLKKGSIDEYDNIVYLEKEQYSKLCNIAIEHYNQVDKYEEIKNEFISKS